MRDFAVKHPMISLHIFGMTIGFGGAALGLTMNELVVAGFVLSIPYVVITERWQQAAARDRARATAASYPPPYSRRGYAERPIHPR
jgi:hypothetical protein